MALFVLRKLILQTRMRSHPVGLDVWFLVGPFIYFDTSCVRTEKALARLRECEGLHEPSLVAFVISTIISWAGSYCLWCGSCPHRRLNLCGFLSALYREDRRVDSDQTHINTLYSWKQSTRFWWPWPFFSKKLVWNLSLESIDGFEVNLFDCMTGMDKWLDWISVALTLFSMSPHAFHWNNNPSQHTMCTTNWLKQWRRGKK